MKRFCLAVAFCLLCTVQYSMAQKRIAVAILDGASAGPYHDWKITTQVLKAELDETGLFDITVLTAPEADGDFSNFKPNFSHYRAIVMNYDAPDWPEPLRVEFEKYVRDGGGLVIVHAADNAFPNWPEYNLMIGVGGWRNRNENAGPYWYWSGDKLVPDDSPGPAGEHGERLPFQVTARDPDHPILRGLPPVWMHANDELYSKLRGPAKNMTVLATAYSDPKNHGTGRDEPVLMVLNYGKGRVFHTTLGHDVFAMSCAGFITTFQRGTEWAAKGKVTQAVPEYFPTANAPSYRDDIAKMDPAFVH